MDNIENNKNQFIKLIDKHLNGLTSHDENELLINYFESFQKTREWNTELGPKGILEEKMLLRLQNALSPEEDGKLISHKNTLKKKRFLAYTVAASFALLISISYFIFTNNRKELNKAAEIAIVDNAIKTGTDKAKLTLEDGSEVFLEKGETYTTKKLKSNGEQLIYNAKPEALEPQVVYNYLTIPRGGQFFVRLQDSTKVWLNSESKLKYPVTFKRGETRRVELLYGEAFFDVSNDKSQAGSTFKVITDIQEIEVLGTEFNVKAYRGENHILTTLTEGEVAISVGKIRKKLKPNQQSQFNLKDNTISVIPVDAKNETSWKKGLFSFKGKTLKEIMTVMSRWYDIEVEFSDSTVGKVKFNGVLSRNQNIEDILTIIENTHYIGGYQIDDKRIVIKGAFPRK